MKKKILIYPCSNDLRLKEYISLANLLKDIYDIKFLIYRNSSDISRDKDLLTKNNLSYIVMDIDIDIKSKLILIYEKISNFFNLNNTFLSKDTTLGQLYHYHIFLKKYKDAINKISNYLKKISPDIIMMTRDNGYSPVESALLKLAKQDGIKIVLPYLMYHSAEGTYQTVKDNLKYKNYKKANFYQKYIFNKYKNLSYKNYYYYSAFLLSVLDNLDLLSANPWKLGFNKRTDKVLIANQGIYDEYKSLDMDTNKLSIVGDVSYIELYKTYKNKDDIAKKIIKKYNLNKKKFIIVSLPNLAYHRLITEDAEAKYLSNLFSVLTNMDDYNILISLKPAMKKDDYIYLEKEYGFSILNENLMSVLPIANLFIVTYSSTILWSILCGIKTIMINYMAKIDGYYTYSSICRVDKEEELSSKIKSTISQDIDFNDDWKVLSKDAVFNEHIKDNYLNTLKDL